MKRRLWSILAMVLVLGLVAPAGADPPDVTQWKLARRIPAGPAGWTTLALDGPIYADARSDLADLRIMDADRRELPWQLLPTASGGIEQYPVRTLDAMGDDRKATLVLDLGRAGVVTNQVTFATAAHNFFVRLTYEVSADLTDWQTLPGSDVLYDMAARGGGAQLTARYPETSYRYLRVTMTGVVPPVTTLSAHLEHQLPPPAPEQAVPAELLAQEQPGHDVRMTFDLGYAGIPLSAMRLTSPAPLFQRAAIVEGSADGLQWQMVTRAAFYRYPDQEQTAFPLHATFRYYRLTILGGDDTPLAPETVTFLSIPQRLLFNRPEGRELFLLYGNPSAATPQYDRTPFRAAPAAPPQITLGAPEPVVTTPGAAQAPAPPPKSDADPTQWRFERPLGLGEQTGFVQVPLDATTLDGARSDLADLRLVDEAGLDVPYQLRRVRDEGATTWPYTIANHATEQGATWWVLDLGSRNLPSNFLHLGGADKNFTRDVRVEGSNDGSSWAPVARGQVRSVETIFGLSEQRWLSYAEAHFRYLRVTVQGPAGDLAPDEVRGSVPALVFRAQAGDQYRLFYGNASAGRPSYPAAAFIGAYSPARVAGALGSVVDHTPPPERPAILRPGTPPDVSGPASPGLRWALWGLLGALAIGLGYGIVRVFRAVVARERE